MWSECSYMSGSRRVATAFNLLVIWCWQQRLSCNVYWVMPLQSTMHVTHLCQCLSVCHTQTSTVNVAEHIIGLFDHVAAPSWISRARGLGKIPTASLLIGGAK